MITPKIHGLRNSLEMRQGIKMDSQGRQKIFTREGFRCKSMLNKVSRVKHLRYLSEFANHSKLKDILDRHHPQYVKLTNNRYRKKLNFRQNFGNYPQDNLNPALQLSLIPVIFPNRNTPSLKSPSNNYANDPPSRDASPQSISLIKSLEVRPGRRIILSKLANKSYNIIFKHKKDRHLAFYL